MTHIPIPGSIIGMMILFVGLAFNLIKRDWLSIGSSFLLKNLPILFVPATVGVIDYLDLFKGLGLISIIISFVSTMVVLITSAIVSDRMLQRGKDMRKSEELHL